MIKGILFDKDGILVEFQTMWHQIMTNVFVRMEAELDFCQEDIEKLKKISGYENEGFTEESAVQSLSTRELIKMWSEHLEFENVHLNERLFEIFQHSSLEKNIDIRLLKGVEESLKYLKGKGYVLGVATADTKESAIYNLGKTNILKYFSFIGSDDGEMLAKPNADMANRFCRKEGIKKEELLIMGDSMVDFQFAKVAQAQFVGLKAEYGELKNLVESDIVLVDNMPAMIREMNL